MQRYAHAFVAAKSCDATVPKMGAPFPDQHSLLRIDSELRLLTLNGDKQPNAALPLARSVASEIRGIPNSQLRGLFNGRLARIYVTLNKTEAVEWLTGLPSKAKEHTYNDYKAEAYSAAVAVQDSPRSQMELVDRGLETGAFQISELPGMLQRLQKQTPIDAIALFRQAAVAFPANAPTEQDVRFLLHLTHMMVGLSPDDAETAVKLMIAALDNPTLQLTPQKDLPKFLTAQLLKDREASLSDQVESLAVALHAGSETESSQSPVRQRLSRTSVQTVQLPTAANDGQPSAEFQSATIGLHSAVADDDILRLAKSIEDRGERARFFLLVVRKLQHDPASLARLASVIFDTTDGSDDLGLSLTVPRMVLHSALTANDQSAAQLALASFGHGAENECKDSRVEEGDAEYAKGTGCINEYNLMATEIARSPFGSTLQISDPSLVERIELVDPRNCGPSTASSVTQAR
jgi:hypothetical protein